MPRGANMNWPAYCNGGDMGSREEPARLIAVNSHRSHAKNPACQEPCWLREAGTGEWKRSLPSRRQKVQVLPVRRGAAAHLADTAPPPTPPPPPAPPPPPSSAPTPPPSPFAEYVAVTPPEPPPLPAAPPLGTGKASLPTPKELMVQWGPPRPPLIAPSSPPQFPPKLYDMFDWAVQQGWDEGDMGVWLFQCVYLCYWHLVGFVPGMVPVATEMRRPSLVTGRVMDLMPNLQGGRAA